MSESTCQNCKYALLTDTGYSNYTVMGADFECLAKVHPDDGFDIFYGEDDRLKIDCNTFTEGHPVEVDVDMEQGEMKDYMDDEQYQLYQLNMQQ